MRDSRVISLQHSFSGMDFAMSVLRLFFHFIFAVALIFYSGIFAVNASAESIGDKKVDINYAKEYIARVSNQILGIMNDASISKAEKEQKISKLLDDDMDLDGVARFVLGIYVRGAKKEEFEEFKKAFKEYIVKSYINKAKNDPEQKKVVVTGGNPIASDRFIVYSEVVSDDPTAPKVLADWEVVLKDGRILVSDMRFEGVSLKLNQRNEYVSLLEGRYGRSVAKLTKAIKRLNSRS